jgi:hypothetical protein
MGNQNPACQCFLNIPFPILPPGEPIFRADFKNHTIPGLTDQEIEVLKNLAEAWNVFVKIEGKHPQENEEFCHKIHDLQRIIAYRVARRLDPQIWTQYPPDGD